MIGLSIKRPVAVAMNVLRSPSLRSSIRSPSAPSLRASASRLITTPPTRHLTVTRSPRRITCWRLMCLARSVSPAFSLESATRPTACTRLPSRAAWLGASQRASAERSSGE